MQESSKANHKKVIMISQSEVLKRPSAGNKYFGGVITHSSR